MFSLATKHDDPQKKLGLVERVGYSLGDFACNMIYLPMSAFLMFYYTNVAGIEAGVAATVLAISRVIDALTDLLMGYLVDHTKSKAGKARPWILRFCIPQAIAMVLMYSIPQAFGGMAKIVWMFITYNLVFSVCYTAINMPYSSMLNFMTDNSEEHGILGNFRFVFVIACQLLLNAFTLPMVRALGNGDTYDQTGWTRVALLLGLGSIVVYFFCFVMTKERVRSPQGEGEAPKIGFFTALKSLVKNKYYIILCLASAVSYIQMSVTGSTTVYFAQYLLDDVDTYAILTNVLQIAEFITILLVAPLLRKRFGKDNLYKAGIVVNLIAYVGTAFCLHTLFGISVCNALKGIGTGLISATMFGVEADTVSYGEKITGVSCAGTAYAVYGFVKKVSTAIGTLVFSFVMNLGHFDASLKQQTAAGKAAISFNYVWVPVIFTAALLVIMLFYHGERDLKRMKEASDVN